MGAVREVQILLNAKDDASQAFESLAASITPLTVAFAAAVAAATAFAAAIYSATKAAATQEEADVRLAVALRSVGENTAAGRAEWARYIDALEDATKVNDEQIASVAALLAQFGHLSGDALKRATKAVLEYSAAIGTDATSSAEQLINVLVRGSGRLAGINTKFDEGTTNAEKFASVLAQMENQGGNTAEVLGGTFNSALKQIGIEWERVLETTGKTIIENDAVRDAFEELAAAIKKTGEFIAEHQAGFELLVTIVGRVAEAAANAIPKVAKFVGWILTMGQIDLVIGALDALGAKFKEAAESAVDVPEKVGNVAPIIHDVGDAFKHATKEITEFTTALPPLEGLDAILDRLGLDTMPALEQATRDVDNALDQLVADAQAGLVSPEQWDLILESVTRITEQLPAWSEDLHAAVPHAQHILDVMSEIADTAAGAATDSALQMGDALVDAALGADIAWDKFFVGLLADFTKAILRAIILQAIMGAFSGGTSLATGAGAGGGGVPIGGGMMAEGLSASLMPASVMLPRPAGEAAGLSGTARGRMSEPGAGGIPGAMQILARIEPRRDREAEAIELLEEIAVLVERRGYRMPATHIVA